MIGKIIALLVIGLVFVAITGYNPTPLYADYTHVRDSVQPVTDNLIENGLNYTANSHLNKIIVNYTGVFKP